MKMNAPISNQNVSSGSEMLDLPPIQWDLLPNDPIILTTNNDNKVDKHREIESKELGESSLAGKQHLMDINEAATQEIVSVEAEQESIIVETDTVLTNESSSTSRNHPSDAEEVFLLHSGHKVMKARFIATHKEDTVYGKLLLPTEVIIFKVNTKQYFEEFDKDRHCIKSYVVWSLENVQRYRNIPLSAA